MTAHPVGFINLLWLLNRRWAWSKLCLWRMERVRKEAGAQQGGSSSAASNSHNMPPVTLAPRVKLVSFSTKAAHSPGQLDFAALATWGFRICYSEGHNGSDTLWQVLGLSFPEDALTWQQLLPQALVRAGFCGGKWKGIETHRKHDGR